MTSIPAVKAALVSVLTAALPNSQVIYGPVTAVTTTSGRILTVRGAIGTRELDSLSLLTTAEQYVLELVVSVDVQAGSSQQDATELALADYAAAELAIREHPTAPTLGLGDGIKVLPTGEFELSEQADSNGRHAAVRFGVQVYAQNT